MYNSKVKILHVTFNMGIGGTEQVISQIIKSSDSERFSHEILCIDGKIGPLGQALQKKGIHIESIQRQPGTDYKLLQFMRRLLKQRKVNVLHCHQYTPYFYGVLSAFWTNTRVIFTEHGRFFPDRHNIKRRFINPRLAMITDHITAISKSTAEAVVKYEYMPRNKIQVIYNGIKTIETCDKTRDDLLNELGLSSGYRYIGTISRLEPIKNQAMMINAFFKVWQRISNIRLILIGDGAKMQELKRLTEALGIQDDVIFTGFIDNPQKYINLFDIFLLSSFSEGTSMTLLEAMSLSKPCIATDVGGNPEIVVDGDTGIVVPSDDTEEFTRAIIELLLNEEKLQVYGKAGNSRFIHNFTALQMINNYQKLYLVN